MDMHAEQSLVQDRSHRRQVGIFRILQSLTLNNHPTSFAVYAVTLLLSMPSATSLRSFLRVTVMVAMLSSVKYDSLSAFRRRRTRVALYTMMLSCVPVALGLVRRYSLVSHSSCAWPQFAVDSSSRSCAADGLGKYHQNVEKAR